MGLDEERAQVAEAWSVPAPGRPRTMPEASYEAVPASMQSPGIDAGYNLLAVELVLSCRLRRRAVRRDLHSGYWRGASEQELDRTLLALPRTCRCMTREA